MGETEIHVIQILALFHMLRTFYRQRMDIYVGANMCMYYVEGNPHRMISPDVFVSFNVENYQRRTYKLWEEGKGPDVIIEITSSSTRREDMEHKPELYRQIGVREYFLFDPLNEYLDPPLQSFTFAPEGMQHKTGMELYSQVLELRLVVQPDGLRLIDPRTGQVLSTPDESIAQAMAAREEARREAARAQQEATRAQQEATRADRAEAELARLREELAKLRGENP